MKSGDTVETYTHPGQRFVIVSIDTRAHAVQLRAEDGKEVWVGRALVKPNND